MAWKEFEYSKVPLRDPAFRPYVKVVLSGDNGKNLTVTALIDSGARRTIVEKGLAPIFGVKLTECEKTDVAGIMGDGIGYKSELNLSFPDFPRKNYQSPVVFTKMLSIDMILGEDLFFKNFKILFEGNETFQLNPITRISS